MPPCLMASLFETATNRCGPGRLDLPSHRNSAPLVSSDQLPNVWDLHVWAAEATNAAYRDEPSLIVWDFELDGAANRVP